MMFYAVYRKIRGLHNIMGNILCHITHCYYMREKHITLFFNREIYLQGLSSLVFSRVVDSACKSCQEKQKHVKTGATSNCSRVGQTEREKENYFWKQKAKTHDYRNKTFLFCTVAFWENAANLAEIFLIWYRKEAKLLWVSKRYLAQ